ncbi:MAG: hypothetical protein IPK72_22325 [Candidatus Eisenbacteria bacterium]|nr:hypothetical protein [Candidatus Eisenbacteria bacterium]
MTLERDSGCVFVANRTEISSVDPGGWAPIRRNGDVSSHHIIEGCTFVGNKASDSGGAIYACPSNAAGSVIEIRNCLFLQNECPLGGRDPCR